MTGRGLFSFFSPDEIEQNREVNREFSIGTSKCDECGLYRKCKSPKMNYTGKGMKECLIIGEAPGSKEDEVGSQFARHADAGTRLRTEVSNNGYELDRDFWKINAVNCRPFKVSQRGSVSNRTPTKAEIRFCKPMVDKAIIDLKPKYIWLMGGAALESFYAGEFRKFALSRWRGLNIPDQRHKAFISPSFHPSYIIRDPKNTHLNAVFKRDIKNACSVINKKLPDRHAHSVRRIYDFDDVLALLNRIDKNPPGYMSFDYETTGLKPYRPGHRIATIGLCYEEGKGIAFPYQYRNHWSDNQLRHIKKYWRRILLNKYIQKIAHNLKFEDVWSAEIMGVPVTSWYWDTMIASHILDNRDKFTSLNFQIYSQFGEYPYDQNIKRYLKGKKNKFNRIDEAPLDELLEYNGLDAIWSHYLSPHQEELYGQRGEMLVEAYDFFHKSAITFSKIERRGIHVDGDYLLSQSNQKNDGELDLQVNELTETLLHGKDAELFKKKTGKKLDLDSTQDLAVLFYDILKYPPIKTDKGNPSVDKFALEKIRLPFVKDLLRLRKVQKTRDYILLFLRETYEGVMHPFFNLHLVKTFRSSSSDPNFQNVPKRDQEARMVTRRAIKPSPGRQLVASDFSGVEVGISCCYHKDPNMITYVNDETTDMHRDSAGDIFKLPNNEVQKWIRFHAKNGWVFPLFYGSWYGECSKNLWEISKNLTTVSGKPLREHLRDNKIISFQAFETHCRKAENIFWNDRFPVYKKWKEEICKQYVKYGFIETYLGFEFLGYMTRNECTNYPIQGTAFHCLLWTLINIELKALQYNWQSELIGQIHDEMINDTEPEELDLVVSTIDQVGTKDIKAEFPWINVNLKIEHEASPIDGNWYELEEI